MIKFKKNKSEDTEHIIKAKKKNFKSIDIKELGNTLIDEEEYENVKKIAKEECKQGVIVFVFLVVLTLAFALNTFRFNSPNMNFITILAIMFFAYIEYQLFQHIKGLYSCNIKQSKYGEVMKKYIITRINEDGTDKDYYLDVIFEDSNTFIRRVTISREIYKKINHKDRVLVVSFDDKMAYGIIPKKREKHA